ncbi:hypothetical protein FJY93_02325 [Candidatus Kaiserbacteria bacterium]|nr:hypothetical protein [Candidatus Kaiserbacteria bacterium]
MKETLDQAKARIRARLDAYDGGLGDGTIDEEAKPLIVVLELLGIETTASCGGHADFLKFGYPWMQGILKDRDKNHRQRKQIEGWLTEFNSCRHQNAVALRLNPHVLNGFRIATQDETDNGRALGKLSFRLVRKAQAEFRAFTQFLEAKVDASGI